MVSIQERLRRIQHKGQMFLTDIATWMGANRGTVQAWSRGVVPFKTRLLQINASLDALEAEIDKGKKFPIPLSISQYERKDYIIGVRDGHDAGVSGMGTSQ